MLKKAALTKWPKANSIGGGDILACGSKVGVMTLLAQM